jgi:hypothetical protein
MALVGDVFERERRASASSTRIGTPDQIESRRHGCPLGQWFLFSEPVLAEKVLPL